MSLVEVLVAKTVGKFWAVTGPDSRQCTAIPHQLQQDLGLGIVYGNAKDTYGNAPDSLYVKNINTPSFVPIEGAIGVSKVGEWGHTWVVRKGSTPTVQNVLEQNNPVGAATRAVSNNYNGVYGYFTPRALVGAPAQPTPTPVDKPRAANDGVVNGQGLHGHTEPNLTSPWPWFFDDNEHVTILAKTQGPTPNVGPYKPSAWWYLVEGNGSPKVWVSDEFIHTLNQPAAVPDWTPAPATPDPTPVNQYSPRPATGIFGVDVSSVGQGQIDWDKLVNGETGRAGEGAGIDFAVARAGHVGKSYGGDDDSKDPQFDRNRAEALRLNIPFGAYWFCYPSLDPKAEAQNFADVVAQVEDSESLWADIETDPVAGDHDLVEWATTFKAEVERLTKHKLRAYFNVDFANRYPGLVSLFKADGIWAAKFDNDPTNGRPFDGAVIDQYTSDGKLPGISGRVDLNVAYMTKAEFLALGKPITIIGTQPPAPTGTPGIDPSISDKLDVQTNLLNQILVLLKELVAAFSRVFK